ncbi:MAG: PEGA domain-containing protein [Usitatibacter sp.]
MSSPAPRPVHASVAYLRIGQFEVLTVAEQAARKQRLEEGARRVLATVPESERIVLDAEDGLAVVLFGETSRAMDVTLSLHRDAGEGAQAGLNFGPLALSSQANDARVFGDGLAQAAAAARFAEGNKLLATESFTRALQGSAPDRAVELVAAGEFTDTRVRMHAFYSPDAKRRGARRRRMLTFAVGGAALILLLGVAARSIYQPMMQLRQAIVILDVKPRGEVFVDGNSVGRIPPLTQIEVAPGKHRITIRSAGVRPYETTLELAPGQRFTITHVFPLPAQKPDFWRDLRRRFGS